jgi:hypothetical protein
MIWFGAHDRIAQGLFAVAASGILTSGLLAFLLILNQSQLVSCQQPALRQIEQSDEEYAAYKIVWFYH